jgi:hypothetical protein
MKNLILLCLVFGIVNSSIAQTLRGDRTLAWQVDLPENANYDSAYFYARKGCMESIHLFFP